MLSVAMSAAEPAVGWLEDAVPQARTILANHPHFRGRAATFELRECDRVLLVRGQVPSYYLKQVLQSVLRDVSGIRRIDNRVDVVCPNGLSSVRRR